MCQRVKTNYLFYNKTNLLHAAGILNPSLASEGDSICHFTGKGVKHQFAKQASTIWAASTRPYTLNIPNTQIP